MYNSNESQSTEVLAVLASIITDGIKVIVNCVEHNGYDDSDFCDIILDLANRNIFEYCTHSTRGAGYRSLADSVAITIYSEEVQNALYKEFDAISREVADKHYKENNIKHAGDTLQVTNPKARKHKGEVFICTGFEEYRDHYGRLQTLYALGEGVRTNVKNCSVLTVNPKVLNEARDNLFYGCKL